MDFQIGEKVIHSSFGFAEIIGIENKVFNGTKQQYYVVKTKDMLIWVPTSDHFSIKIRLPSSKNDFQGCFDILRSKYSPFSTDRNIRKKTIQSKLNDGAISTLCEIIRDLSFYRIQNKLNDSEKLILEKAIVVLIDEWGFVFSITTSKARSELTKLLNESYAASV
jgi:CarD family transcriptional regulator